MAFLNWEKGILPDPVGWSNQVATYCDVIRIVSAEKGRIEEDNRKKD